MSNAMSDWPEIACQRGHRYHESRQVTVTLGGPTPYGDLTPIPVRLGRQFEMLVWDPDLYKVDSVGIYCPAHDCVSETIASLGVWAPDETTLALGVMDGRGDRDELFVDFGAQIGWFTMLAASCGLSVLAVEADAENQRILGQNVALNGWGDLVEVLPLRVRPDTQPFPPTRVRLAKLDVEGAEDQCIRLLWPSIEAGLVDHLLMEVTPSFADYWPDLIANIAEAGYRVWTLPPKQRPPIDLANPETALASYELSTLGRSRLVATVASWTEQTMVWLRRQGAEW